MALPRHPRTSFSPEDSFLFCFLKSLGPLQEGRGGRNTDNLRSTRVLFALAQANELMAKINK